MKKQSKKQQIKALLDKANRKFVGKWMAAEDMTYIFPIDSIEYLGKPADDVPSDPEKAPLGIQTNLFINEPHDLPKISDIVELGPTVVFHNNPYNITERDVIKFIPKAEARAFVTTIVKQLDALRSTLTTMKYMKFPSNRHSRPGEA